MAISQHDHQQTSFTLDDLAAAMRGMPRAARIMIRTGGELRPLAGVSGSYEGAAGDPTQRAGAPYVIVLEPWP